MRSKEAQRLLRERDPGDSRPERAGLCVPLAAARAPDATTPNAAPALERCLGTQSPAHQPKSSYGKAPKYATIRPSLPPDLRWEKKVS